MNEKEYIISVKNMIYLCKCAVSSTSPDRGRIEKCNIRYLYEVANHHMLTAMTGMALKDAGINDSNFSLAVAASQRKTLVLNEEKRRVFEKLDEAEIWHIALKGTVIRDWYPKFAMRESADCDILFDNKYEEQVKCIMVDLGYSVASYGKGHHDVYIKKPLTNMQMHVALFGVGFEKRLNDYYEDVYDHLEGSGFEKYFNQEDFYIYILAHNHNDYINGGCGIRSLLDTFVILNRFDFDWDYIRRETEILQIREFEEKNRSLALHLFTGEDLSNEDKSRLEYMAMSGVYGTIKNAVGNKINRHGGGISGKVKYLIERLILPMEVVEHSFPAFYKHKVLLPFLPIYRVVRGLTANGKKVKAEFQALINEYSARD